MRVALFITCFNDTLFPQVGIATTQVLERLGHTVVFPEAQTCCGQMHYNTGYQREALTLVRHFVEVFEASDVEAIVAPSASCVGMVRDLYPTAAAHAGDARLVAQVDALVPRVYELGEFLVKRLGVVDVGAYFPHRVTYHATCHSLRVLRVGEIPMQLLRAVKGIDLVELPHVTECCGFGGTFAIKNAEVSTAMLGDKARDVLLIPVQVEKEMIRWRHEYQDGPAGLARRTAETRLGAQTSGLEAAGQRRRARGERWSREPVAVTSARPRGRGRVAAPCGPRSPPKLTPAQLGQLPALLARGAEAAGFRGPVWTCPRVGAVIRRPFGVTSHPSHLGRLLQRLGYRVQRPSERATQRRDEAVRLWWEQRGPALKKKRPTKAE